MIGDRLKASHEADLGIAAVDLFAGALLAIFVMYVIYIWLYQDRASQCFVDFKDHARRIHQTQPEAFNAEPTFSFQHTRLVLKESWLSFEPCLWELPPARQDRLRQLFGELVPEKFRGCIESVRIEGHADTTPFFVASCARAHPSRANDFSRIGPWTDNTQLSQNRARAVFETLRAMPFVEKMWKEHKIHIGGYGDSWPLDDDPGSPRNRRVELHLKFSEGEARSTDLAPDNASSKQP